MWLLSSGSSAVDPVSLLLTYGPLGVFAILLVTGLLVPKSSHDKVISENERLRRELESTIPLISKNSEVTAEAIALIHLLNQQVIQQSTIAAIKEGRDQERQSRRRTT